MPIIERDKPYPTPDRYWDMVQATLEDVFGMTTFNATNSVNKLRTAITDCPKGEQLQFYHMEPLDIASDLVGKRPKSDEIRAYRAAAAKYNWKP